MTSMEKFSASILQNWLKNSQDRLEYNETNKNSNLEKSKTFKEMINQPC